jgi:hypothetical protein
MHQCNHATFPNTPTPHHSTIPGWKKKNGWLGIPCYQRFVEVSLHLPGSWQLYCCKLTLKIFYGLSISKCHKEVTAAAIIKMRYEER